MSDSNYELFAEQLKKHLGILYPDENMEELASAVGAIFAALQPAALPAMPWSEKDCLVISYGDSIVAKDESPLRTLGAFLDRHCGDVITALHILPFYPFSSDDGFSVIDYEIVREDLGCWDDIENIAQRRKLMVDLVINHASSESRWFKEYCSGESRRQGYFIEASIEDDLSQVVRPRATPLLRATHTDSGIKQLWCTFSHDQVDVNFSNPQVLLEFLRIVKLYLSKRTSIIRLDAIGYLWKKTGTTCIHLPETHEVVRLLRTVCDYYAPGTVLITETNVPNHENLTYFGNRNEAHAIYNFSLAPLLLHALLSGETGHLKRWMMSMPPAPAGCFYLNFTASHDGIGMRPAEGLLSDHEQFQLVETIRSFGGQFSTRRTADGSERVYELNIALFDAMQGTLKGPDQLQEQRFLCSQTVMMGIEGIPAFYIHSLLATRNDLQQVAATGRSRSINRHRWQLDEIEGRLAEPDSDQRLVLNEVLRRMRIRGLQTAFHPNATQFTLQLDQAFFAFWRQSRDRSQSIFAIHNLSDQVQPLRLTDLNLISFDTWYDLLSGQLMDDLSAELSIPPYGCLWLSNRLIA